MYPETETGSSLLGLLPSLSLVAYPSLPWAPAGLEQRGEPFFSKQCAFRTPPTVHGLSAVRSQVLPAPHEGNSPARLHRSGCCFSVFLFSLKTSFFSYNKISVVFSVLPPPVTPLMAKD